MQAELKRIFTTFLVPGCDFQIDLPHSIYSDIEEIVMSDTRAGDQFIFDKALKNIEYILENKDLMDWTKSSSYTLKEKTVDKARVLKSIESIEGILANHDYCQYFKVIICFFKLIYKTKLYNFHYIQSSFINQQFSMHSVSWSLSSVVKIWNSIAK